MNKSKCKNEALSSDPSTQVKGVLGHVHACAQCCVGGDKRTTGVAGYQFLMDSVEDLVSEEQHGEW